MATITAKDVMALRKSTGLGMMECKKALTEVEGDMDKAADLVRKKYGAKMASRSDRESTEGKIAVAVSADGTKGAIVQINTETDFTSGNDAFGAMAQQIADMALEQNPGDAQKTDAIEAAIEAVRLVTQENIQFAQGRVFENAAGKIGNYVHFTGKVGVAVEVEGNADEQLLKDLCMHISAITPAPFGVTEDTVPADVLAEERRHAKEEALASGKPEEIAEKMVEGKLRKYLDSVVLLRQTFVKDDKKKIKDILPAGVTIKSFARYQVGG